MVLREYFKLSSSCTTVRSGSFDFVLLLLRLLPILVEPYSSSTPSPLTHSYTHQHQLLILFLRWQQDQPSWSLPILYLLLRDLRSFAEQADAATFASTGRTPSLEECTRTVSKAFTLCATDRTFEGSQSRRVGVYYLACLSIKCYFKVGKPNLCKNIVRAVTSDPKMPPVSSAPKGDQVTWHYYLGMLAFLAGEDRKASDELEWALLYCPVEARRNQE